MFPIRCSLEINNNFFFCVWTATSTFQIDTATGEVSVIASPNYETATSYLFTVTVEDAGATPITSSVYLQVSTVTFDFEFMDCILVLSDSSLHWRLFGAAIIIVGAAIVIAVTALSLFLSLNPSMNIQKYLSTYLFEISMLHQGFFYTMYKGVQLFV